MTGPWQYRDEACAALSYMQQDKLSCSLCPAADLEQRVSCCTCSNTPEQGPTAGRAACMREMACRAFRTCWLTMVVLGFCRQPAACQCTRSARVSGQL